MAIQVGGTQVIGNSRELTNIASVDATTISSCNAQLSPTIPSAHAVGSYLIGLPKNTTIYAAGTTISSGLYDYPWLWSPVVVRNGGTIYNLQTSVGSAVSGTWRACHPMRPNPYAGYNDQCSGIFVRIS